MHRNSCSGNKKICETKTSFSKWNKKHWNSIVANYGKSIGFKNHKDVFESLYLDCKTDNLSEINLLFIKEINKLLGINTEIIDSKELDLEGDKNQRLIEAIKKVGGNTYLSGPAAKSYLDESLFKKEGIHVEWKSYSNYPEYTNIHPEFYHGISILDVIFNNSYLNHYLITSND